MDEINVTANAEEVVTPQTEPQEQMQEVTAEPQLAEQTETQRVAQRIKEATEKAKQEAKDEFIASQGYEWNGKPITTEKEYNEALKELELRKQYENQELPEEVVNELVESRKFREIYQAEQETKRSEEAKQKDQLDFLNWFKEENGRDFDSNKDFIPQEVWEENSKGKSLVDAYAKYERNEFKLKLSEIEKQKQIQEANQKNAENSTGSAKSNGNVPNGYIAKEEFEQNKHDQSWLIKNYDNLKKSMNKWGR